MRRWTLSAMAVTAAIALAGCTTASTSPSASTAASAPPSAPASVEASASTPASPAASTVASVPAGQLIFPAKLVICMDQPYPPQNFFDAQGNPIGADVELGTEIAKRLGLTAQFENSVFETIIAALTGGKCDIILSEQNITAGPAGAGRHDPVLPGRPVIRRGQGQSQGDQGDRRPVRQGISAETGTTEVDYLNGTGDYKGKGLSASVHRQGPRGHRRQGVPEGHRSVVALLGGQVDAYFADSPVAGYYTVAAS